MARVLVHIPHSGSGAVVAYFVDAGLKTSNIKGLLMSKQLKLFTEELTTCDNSNEKKTYNHAFDVVFSVSGSEYEDSFECLSNEPEKVIASLQKRIKNIFGSPEHLEEIDGLDTYCEQED